MRFALFLIALVLFVTFASASASRKINLGCTIKCTAYWTCMARGVWEGNTSGCNLPSGCECRKFAWQSDKHQEVFAENILNLARSSIRFEEESDAPFSAVCTAECTLYWGCRARNAFEGRNGNCSPPRGCECRKFAWDY